MMKLCNLKENNKNAQQVPPSAIYLLHVRMAERSKAPDSRLPCLVSGLMSVLVHFCGRGFESHF
jgi:hypothetical protein